MMVWGSETEERQFKMKRAMGQDIGWSMRNEDLKKIFPDKKVKNENIGERCRDWAYKILTRFKSDEDIQTMCTFTLYVLYKKGINPDKSEIWKLIYLDCAHLFSSKIDDMDNISKMAYMDQLEKPTIKSESSEELYG